MGLELPSIIMTMTTKKYLITTFKNWWRTDCKVCQKMRQILLWLVLMIVIDMFWFHLIFK